RCLRRAPGRRKMSGQRVIRDRWRRFASCRRPGDRGEPAMRALLLNPPHPAVSSRCHEGRMPPLGLLAVGGPRPAPGHPLRLTGAEIGPLSTRQIVAAVTAWAPDAVLVGHSGSTSAHPVIVEIARAVKAASPRVWVVYGGVYPTYHAAEI